MFSVKAGTHVFEDGWCRGGGGEVAQQGLFKREMDRGSKQGTNIPLQQAHDSASIRTPLSLPLIHHSLTSPTSHFHPTSIPPHSLSLTLCLRCKCLWDSAVSKAHTLSFNPDGDPSSAISCREHTRERVGCLWLAAWVGGS